jgi:excisionase family DNA binding protein
MTREDDVVMDYETAAEFLRISQRTLQRYVQRGMVPYVRMPRCGDWGAVRFLKMQLLEWMRKRTVKPVQFTRVREASEANGQAA